MQQEYIDQALAVADSFYNLGFAQGLAFGIFIAFMVYIKVSDWLEIIMKYDSHVFQFKLYSLFESHVFEYKHHQFKEFRRRLMSGEINDWEWRNDY